MFTDEEIAHMKSMRWSEEERRAFREKYGLEDNRPTPVNSEVRFDDVSHYHGVGAASAH